MPPHGVVRGHINSVTLLEIDDAWNLMDKEDEKELKREQGDLKNCQQHFDEYLGCYTRRVKALREKAMAIAEMVGKRKKPAAAKQTGGTRTKVPDTTVSQPEAAAMMPPGCSIWRVTATSGWAVQVPPFKRYSASALKCGGEYEAMIHVMRIAWTTYQTIEPLAECQVDGLLGEPAQPLEARASSSSSGATATGKPKRKAKASGTSTS